jgi:hypothetical protein
LSVRAFVQIIGLQFGEDSGWTVLSDLDGRLVRFENGRVVVYVFDDNEQTLGNEIALAEAAVGESENDVVFIFQLMANFFNENSLELLGFLLCKPLCPALFLGKHALLVG